jgi:hypothetical protein
MDYRVGNIDKNASSKSENWHRRKLGRIGLRVAAHVQQGIYYLM